MISLLLDRFGAHNTRARPMNAQVFQQSVTEKRDENHNRNRYTQEQKQN